MEKLCGSQMIRNIEGEYITDFWMYIFSDQAVACSNQPSINQSINHHTEKTAKDFSELFIASNSKLT